MLTLKDRLTDFGCTTNSSRIPSLLVEFKPLRKTSHAPGLWCWLMIPTKEAHVYCRKCHQPNEWSNRINPLVIPSSISFLVNQWLPCDQHCLDHLNVWFWDQGSCLIKLGVHYWKELRCPLLCKPWTQIVTDSIVCLLHMLHGMTGFARLDRLTIFQVSMAQTAFQMARGLFVSLLDIDNEESIRFGNYA